MDRTSTTARLLLCVCCLSLVVGQHIAFVAAATPPNIFARVSDVDVMRQGGTAMASFKIHVTNHESSPLINVAAVFADGTSLAIGDVAAEATAVTEAQNRIIELALPESESIPVPVTFTLFFEDQTFEVEWILNLGNQ